MSTPRTTRTPSPSPATLHHRTTAASQPMAAPPAPPGEESQRKQRVLTKGTPSITSTIADAVVIKDGDLFFLSEPDGRVPLSQDHGFGLYYHDCRFLKGYDLTLAGSHPVVLGWASEAGNRSTFELTNSDLYVGGETVLDKEGLGIRWDRSLDERHRTLEDRITFQNYRHQPVDLPLELRFDAGFEDVFQVRGLLHERLGRLYPPTWTDTGLVFAYDGADGLHRSLEVAFSPGLHPTGAGSAGRTLHLEGRGTTELVVRVRLEEVGRAGGAGRERARPAAFPRRAATAVESDSVLLIRVADRSFRDLDLLRSSIDGLDFFAAGVPWFATLFGRDSLITALEILAWEPELAAHTLRLVARYQATEKNEWRDEEPGKILHSLRVGEMAGAGAIPHTPYYGSIDATPLFLVVLASHAKSTGDLSLFTELRPNVERALEWMERDGDRDGDGYIEYRSRSEHGLINQGWKDSGDAIVDEQGRLATPPIALVEVQGYAYDAYTLMADLFRRTGDEERAGRLEATAERLRERFNRDYWQSERGFYGLALEADKRLLPVVSSNAGHALWSGIADADKAKATANRLMAGDMFSGWGVRTLSTEERGYTPIGYHLGTVWPHDNALVAAGFRRYGQDAAAKRIFEGILAAATHFEQGRLPELFTGFGRDRYDVPISYPVACHPQAWAAGAIPFLLQVLLGLVPDGFGRKLRIERPMLPDSADVVQVNGLRVGDAVAALRFGRNADRTVSVETIAIEGDLEVIHDGTAANQ